MSEEARIHRVFDDVHAHRRIARLIRRFSTNRRGIHRTALEGLDLKACDSILDLGCAFGSFTEKLKGRVGARAAVAGVDAVAAYGPLFLAACRRAGLKGTFHGSGISVLGHLADRSCDLILCSYALYFFPEAIPGVARVLRKGGLFVAITHHRRNAGELIAWMKGTLDALGLYHKPHLPLEIITRRFSAENGRALLEPWFGEVRTIDYPNELVFPEGDTEPLKAYLRFKSPLYFTDTKLNPESLMPAVLERLARDVSALGGMRICKDDRIFICTSPRHGEDRT